MSGIFSRPLWFIVPSSQLLPFPSIKKIKKQIEEFNGLLYGIIDDRLKKRKISNEMEEYSDLLNMMIESMEEDILTKRELRDNVMIFFLAGHDTTSNSLSMTLYLLAKYPLIQQKVREEVLKIMSLSGESKQRIIPTFEEQKELEYLTMVIKESLRLYPPVPSLPLRKTSSKVKLDENLIIPENTLISINIYHIHHSPLLWENPEEFQPERFSKDSSQNFHPFQWNPFGGSVRSCIGSDFSMIEQRMLLSAILLKYDVELTPNTEPIQFQSFGFLSPRDLFLQFKRRY